jgi:hypothetical protein
VQHISAYDTPVYTGESVPEDVLENLVDPTWVDDMKRKGVRTLVTSPACLASSRRSPTTP